MSGGQHSGPRFVAFVCTDGGQHARNVLGEWTLAEDGQPRQISTAPHRPGPAADRMRKGYHERETGVALPVADMRCRRCGRNPRANADRMRDVLQRLLHAIPDERIVVDVSRGVGANLF
jgi:hypothetical protein